MAESPDGRGVLLFGGATDGDDYDEVRILELRAGAKSWNILNITLQNRRYHHTVLTLL